MSTDHVHASRNPIVCTLALTLLAGCASSPHASEYGPSHGYGAQSFDHGAGRMPSIRTLHSTARILAARNRDPECEVVFARLISLYPRYAPAYNELAELYLRQGLGQSALETLQAGAAACPDDPVLSNNLGMCYILEGDYESALAHFTDATAKRPNDARARANMAAALGLLGREDEAMALYLQVMRRDMAQRNLAILSRAAASGEAPTMETLGRVAQPEEPAAPAPAEAAVAEAAVEAEAPAALETTPQPVVETTEEAVAEEPVAQPVAEAPVAQEPPPAEPGAVAEEPVAQEPTPVAVPAAEELPAAAAEPVEASSQEEPAAQSFFDDELFDDAPEEAAPAQAPAEPTAAFVPEHWHGVDRSALVDVGGVIVQRTPEVEVRLLPSGVKVIVAQDAADPIWVFGQDMDYRLSAGSVATFDRDGSLRASETEIELLPAPADRLSLAQLHR